MNKEQNGSEWDVVNAVVVAIVWCCNWIVVGIVD
jgi:hypothetical protein